MRWLVDSARGRSEKTMAARLAGELLDASEGRGSAVKKREDTHKMAEANKAFATILFISSGFAFALKDISIKGGSACPAASPFTKEPVM